MKSYKIPFSDNTDNSPRLEVDTFGWMKNGYEPKTTARLAINDEKLTISLECKENNPLTRYTENGSPVYKDSCMEFFFAPNDEKSYCNIEINSFGCYLSCIGESRHNRERADVLLTAPRAVKTSEGWGIYAEISLEKVKQLYNINRIEYIRGNIYKCGDETEYPHFGMWSEVETEKPDFHRPEYFGKFVF